jgi:hypothetical protein
MSLKESVLSGAFLMLLRTHEPLSDGHMRTELEVSFFSEFVCQLLAIHVSFSDEDGAL